jgi:UDP-glucuronate decarboxylase
VQYAHPSPATPLTLPQTIKTSTSGTLNMLGLAKRVKARLLFTSTSVRRAPARPLQPSLRVSCVTGRQGFRSRPFRVPRITIARCRLLASAALGRRPQEIYGDPEVHPQVEEYWGNVNTLGPRSCYDEGKRVAETMCYCYHTECGVEVRLARIFNTFGPRMDPNDGRVVSNFIIQALQRKPITIYGDGSQTRSFQYVSDLVRVRNVW